MGYGGSQEAAGRAIGRSGDGGIDGVINEDPLGLDVVYVQAKRWENTVGRPVVQAFIGSLEGVRAQKGIMMTTSNFSAEARSYVQSIGKRVILIEGRELAGYMLKYGLGVTDKAQYDLKRIDLEHRFGSLRGRYEAIIRQEASGYPHIEDLAYAVLVYETFNRPTVYRWIESHLLFPLGLSRSLGPMQVQTPTRLSDEKAVSLGVQKLLSDFKQLWRRPSWRGL